MMVNNNNVVPVEFAAGSDHFQKFCLASWTLFLFSVVFWSLLLRRALLGWLSGRFGGGRAGGLEVCFLSLLIQSLNTRLNLENLLKSSSFPSEITQMGAKCCVTAGVGTTCS